MKTSGKVPLIAAWLLLGILAAGCSNETARPYPRYVIVDELWADPFLAYDPWYYHSHPEVVFVREHPDFRLALLKDRLRKRGLELADEEARGIDAFLSSHPETARAISRDPRIRTDLQAFVAHPDIAPLLRSRRVEPATPRLEGRARIEPRARVGQPAAVERPMRRAPLLGRGGLL
jgi:hypothetical protein